jgi:hypothetical protein
MILSLVLPRMDRSIRAGTVHRLIARPGDALRAGAALLEVRIDLEQANARDCPSVIFFRLIATERAYLRSLEIALGDSIEPAAPIGIATTTVEEPFDAPATRALRMASVAIQVDPLFV